MIPEGRKRIFHIIQSLNNGGCENMLLRTLPFLREFDHTIITLKELGELAPKFAANDIPVRTVHCNNLFDIPGIIRLQKLVREEAPDIIITYLFHADMLGRLFLQKKTSAPIIPFLRTTYNHPRYFIARLLSRLTRSLVRHYIANSEAVKRFYVEHLGVSNNVIDVLPNGIDIQTFIPSSKNVPLGASLGIIPNDIVLISVANLHPNKGHRYLLEAFEESYQKNTNLKLLIVGDGEERSRLKEQMRGYNSRTNILFLGKRQDVPELLKLSHIFILPTLFEGMSNALMEAMATRLPVITTDIEENRELVENNKTGLLVPIKNSYALAEAIEKLIRNPSLCAKIAQSGQSFIEKNFSLEKISNDWNTLLKQYIEP